MNHNYNPLGKPNSLVLVSRQTKRQMTLYPKPIGCVSNSSTQNSLHDTKPLQNLTRGGYGFMLLTHFMINFLLLLLLVSYQFSKWSKIALHIILFLCNSWQSLSFCCRSHSLIYHPFTHTRQVGYSSFCPFGKWAISALHNIRLLCNSVQSLSSHCCSHSRICYPFTQAH